jgi:hypothetical protein
MISMERFKNLAELINYHLDLHEGVELRDIYKLIHQSVFGPEHLDEGVSEDAIADEMDSAAGGIEEPLLEPISIDASACRINLRAAKRQGITPGIIADAMRQSMNEFSRDHAELVRSWAELGDFLTELHREFRRESFEELTRFAEEKGYPALHHSPSYRERNRPAYRVLMKRELERLMRHQGLRAGTRVPDKNNRNFRD